MTVEPKPLYALTRDIPGITVPVYLSRRGGDIIIGRRDGHDMTYWVVTTAPSIAVTRRTWPGIISVRERLPESVGSQRCVRPARSCGRDLPHGFGVGARPTSAVRPSPYISCRHRGALTGVPLACLR